jgi:hypothetical protein
MKQMSVMRAEKDCYLLKRWTKETFTSVPLLWLDSDTQQSYNHALFISVQIALSLSAAAVASAFASPFSGDPIIFYLTRLCALMIKAGYSIPTASLYARIPQIDNYLSSVVASGGGLRGLHKSPAILIGPASWPAISLITSYDPQEHKVTYAAMYTHDESMYQKWLASLYAQTMLPEDDWAFGDELKVDCEDFFLSHTCSVIVRAPCSGRASQMPTIRMTWADIPDNVEKPSRHLMATRPLGRVEVDSMDTPPGTPPKAARSFLDDSWDEVDESQGPPPWNPQSDTGLDAQVTDDESQVQLQQQEPTATVQPPEKVQRQFLDDDFVDIIPDGETNEAVDEQPVEAEIKDEHDELKEGEQLIDAGESIPVVHKGGFLSDSDGEMYDEAIPIPEGYQMVTTIIWERLLSDDMTGLYQDIADAYAKDGDEAAFVNVIRDLLK